MEEVAPAAACHALFVAFFDPKEGNKLEWSSCNGAAPHGADEAALLENIEMLVLAPGFEKIDEDFVVFRHRTLSDVFGCAAFQKKTTTDSKERFSRMRSVGVMTNSASYARGLEPLLVWLAMRVNEDPAKKSVLEETAEVLFASSQPPLELEVRINALMTSYSAAASTDSSSESAPPHFTAAKTSHQLSIDHESFLVIWRAVVSNYRVLLHSKANAGRLCDITLDLLRSGCAATSQPLMFCTYDYDSDDGWLQGGMTTAWFAASTDMRLVLGMGATSPSWDILIDFDNGASGAQLKQNKSVAQSVVVDTQASGAPSPQGQAAAKFTVHMTHSCDPRVRRTIFKHNLSMWQLVREHGGGSTSSSGAEGTHDSLVAWRRNFDTDAKAIADMQTTEQQSVSDKTTNKLQHSAALQLLLRQYSLHSSHISWLLYLCARRGVDVASVSTLVTLKLRAGVLLSHMCKRSSRGRVVPINS